MWSIGETVACVLRKDIYFSAVGWKVLFISVRFIWSIVLFIYAAFLLFFRLNDLSVIDNKILKSPTIIVLLIISPFSFINVYIIYLGVLMLGAYTFIRVISFCSVEFFIIIWCPSLSLMTVFASKIIFLT